MLDVKGFGKFLEGGKQKKVRGKKVRKESDLAVIGDEILRPVKQARRRKTKTRSNARASAAPVSPYAALMQPVVIAAQDSEGKSVIADAGSIVKLLDQKVLYRDRVSPITKRADEILVQYGKPTDPQLGWLAHNLPPNTLKPVQGPTFLVTTQVESGVSAWDVLRLKVARTRKGNAAMWCAPWLVMNGQKYPRELREVTRLFGGKPIKNESLQDRCNRLFQLILHTEIDMSVAKAKSIASKSGKKSSTKKAAPEKETKTATKTAKKKSSKDKNKIKLSSKDVVIPKKEKKVKAKGKVAKETKSEFSARSRDYDSHIVKRLIQENPRRAGSHKADVWNILKKGMTVEQFAKKGGSRAVIARYIQNGWVKLIKASGGKGNSAEE